MNLENYNQEKKTIDLMKANLVALKYFAFFALIFGLPSLAKGIGYGYIHVAAFISR